MTPRPDPSDLASDLADGLLSGKEAARAVAAPEVAGRVEEIHRLRTALREIPPAPELPKARALAAALEAGMDAHHRASGSPGRGAWRPWLAVAGILAVVVLGVGLFALRDPDDGDVTATAGMDEETSADAAEGSTADDSATDAEEEAPQTPGDGDGESLTTQGDAGLAAVDLGTVADEDELAAAVAGAARSSRTAEPGAASEPQAPTDSAETGDSEQPAQCPQLTADGDPERGESTLFATATLAGEPVWVHLYPRNAGDGNALLVATSSACVDVVNRIVPTDN